MEVVVEQEEEEQKNRRGAHCEVKSEGENQERLTMLYSFIAMRNKGSQSKLIPEVKCKIMTILERQQFCNKTLISFYIRQKFAHI